VTEQKKHILFVYPVIHPDIEFHWMPTSLLAISSKLEREGYTITIVDERVTSKEDFERAVLDAAQDAMLAGMSVMSGYQIKGAIRISRLIKKKYPDLAILWGGDHPTVIPEQVLALESVDFAVMGQGEETIYELVQTLSRQADRRAIKGLAHKVNGRPVINDRRPLHAIDPDYPLPYHLIDVPRYINPQTRAFNYFTSFGCAPGRCKFCNTGGVYRGWYPVAADKVVAQIKDLVERYDFKNCMFQDSNFFVNEKRTADICSGLLRESVGIKWNGSARADQLIGYTDDTIDLMVESGCRCLFIGAESGSQRMLDQMGKMEKAEYVMELARRFNGRPIDLHLSFIFMLPGETVKDLKITIDYIETLKAANPKVKIQRCFYTPYPGTELFDEVCQMGYVPPSNIEGWIDIQQPDSFVDVPWIPDEIKEEYRDVFEENFFEQAKTEF